MRLISQYKTNGSDEVLKEISAMIEANTLSDDQRMKMNSLVRSIISAYEADMDVQKLLRELFKEIENLQSSVRWYEDTSPGNVSEIQKFINSIPDLDLEDGAGILGFRLIALYIKSSSWTSEHDYGNGSLYAKLQNIAIANTGELGREAFDAIGEYRTPIGNIPDPVFQFYLHILWMTMDEGHDSGISMAEKQFRILDRWKEALTTEQKKALVRAGHLFLVGDKNHFIKLVREEGEKIPVGKRMINEIRVRSFQSKISEMRWL